MLIRVTEENIKCGNQDDPRNCPIALACKCAGLDPYVDRDEIRLGEIKVPLPEIARDFIEEFDEGSGDSEEREDEYKAVVKPFEFEIEVGTVAER